MRRILPTLALVFAVIVPGTRAHFGARGDDPNKQSAPGKNIESGAGKPIAEGPEQPGTGAEYPPKDAAYLPTSDIVLAGSSDSFGESGAVRIYDARGAMIQGSNIQRSRVRGEIAWSARLTARRPGGWVPGAYRLQIITAVRGVQISIPISVVADPTGDHEPQALPLTNVLSPEYENLPVLHVPQAVLSNSDIATPDVKVGNATADAEFKIEADSEIAVEGTFLTQELPLLVPSDVVLRLTEPPPRGGAKPTMQPTVGEAIALSGSTDNDNIYRYRTALRVPNRPGKLTLEAIYRKKVIATCVINVAKSSQPKLVVDWVVEHPQPNAVYAMTSEIVLVGKGKPFLTPATVELHDSKDVINQSATLQVRSQDCDGAWSHRLLRPGGGGHAWRPGKYMIMVRPVLGPQISIPISVVIDPKGSKTPPALSDIAVDTDAYKNLPLLRLVTATISNLDNDAPELIDQDDVAGNGLRIQAEREFAVEGRFRAKESGAFEPTDVVIRLADAVDADDSKGQKQTVTIAESVTRTESTDDIRLFNYRTVLRAPDRPGKLALSVIYRKTVIVTTTIEVLPAAQE